MSDISSDSSNRSMSSPPPAAGDGNESIVGNNGASHASFQALDITRVRRTLAKLHEQVACGSGRVEIRRRGCQDVCVMISKCELEALEKALEILSECENYKAMCETVTQVAAKAADSYFQTHA
jgi:hypothetical protein